MSKSLALAILALNEEEGLAKTYNTYLGVLGKHGLDFEIIIINDGSSDKTGAIADQIAQSHASTRVIHHSQPMGIGYSYKDALRKTNKDYLMWTGAYDVFGENEVNKLLDCMGKTDMGLFYILNPEFRPKNRQRMSKLFTGLLNTLTGWNLRYYNGMMICRTEPLKKIKIRSNRYTFQAEAIIKLLRHHHCTFQEIGLPIKDRGKSKSSAIKPRNFLDTGWFLLLIVLEILFTGKSSSPATPRPSNGN